MTEWSLYASNRIDIDRSDNFWVFMGGRMNFLEACKLMKNRHKIRRPCWPNPYCYLEEHEDMAFFGDDDENINLEDILADDWITKEMVDADKGIEMRNEGMRIIGVLMGKGEYDLASELRNVVDYLGSLL